MDAKLLGEGPAQLLEVVINPGEVIVSEPGEFAWISKSIEARAVGSSGGRFRGFRRSRSGNVNAISLMEYAAVDEPGMVAFGARGPGQMMPIDIRPGEDSQFSGHRRSLVCATEGVDVATGFSQAKLGTATFGGEGFKLLQFTGEGRAWVEFGGEVVSYELRDGEELRVHPLHVGLMHSSVKFKLVQLPNVTSRLMGETMFVAQLTGPGRVWLQSTPATRVAADVAQYVDFDASLVGQAVKAAPQPEGNAFMRGLMGRP